MSEHPPDKPGAEGREGQDWAHQPLPPEVLPGDVAGGSAPPSVKAALRKPGLAEELELAARVRRGEREAVQAIYRQYAPALLRRILRLLGGDMSRAEDCLQQVFEKVLRSIGSFRGEGTLHAWLNRVTTHVVVDTFRSRQSRSELLKRFLPVVDLAGGDGNRAIPGRIFDRKEIGELVQGCLRALDRKKRMVLLLVDMEGLTVQEAAQELEIPMGTVASRLHRGRRELRSRLTRELKRSGLTAREWFND